MSARRRPSTTVSSLASSSADGEPEAQRALRQRCGPCPLAATFFKADYRRVPCGRGQPRAELLHHQPPVAQRPPSRRSARRRACRWVPRWVCAAVAGLATLLQHFSQLGTALCLGGAVAYLVWYGLKLRSAADRLRRPGGRRCGRGLRRGRHCTGIDLPDQSQVGHLTSNASTMPGDAVGTHAGICAWIALLSACWHLGGRRVLRRRRVRRLCLRRGGRSSQLRRRAAPVLGLCRRSADSGPGQLPARCRGRNCAVSQRDTATRCSCTCSRICSISTFISTDVGQFQRRDFEPRVLALRCSSWIRGSPAVCSSSPLVSSVQARSRPSRWASRRVSSGHSRCAGAAAARSARVPAAPSGRAKPAAGAGPAAPSALCQRLREKALLLALRTTWDERARRAGQRAAWRCAPQHGWPGGPLAPLRAPCSPPDGGARAAPRRRPAVVAAAAPRHQPMPVR